MICQQLFQQLGEAVAETQFLPFQPQPLMGVPPIVELHEVASTVVFLPERPKRAAGMLQFLQRTTIQQNYVYCRKRIGSAGCKHEANLCAPLPIGGALFIRSFWRELACQGSVNFFPVQGLENNVSYWTSMGVTEERRFFSLIDMAMGQNPNRTPSEHPNPH